jgi:hypothetical protein
MRFHRRDFLDLMTFGECRRQMFSELFGVLVVGRIPGGWDIARELMGEETACVAYYEQPELMLDVLETVGTTAVRVFEQITETLVIDQLLVHEDLAGKSGPLVGPNQVRQFIGPYYRRAWELLSSRGTRLFNLDSDGNVTPVIEPLLHSRFVDFVPFVGKKCRLAMTLLTRRFRRLQQ